MALNPSIILAGQPFDLAGSMSAGNQLAAQTNQLRDQNALRQVYQTQGAGILSGDQNALNALAMVDAPTALAAQGSVLSNRTAQREFEILNAQEKRAIADAAAQMDERQRADALKAAQQEVLRFVMAPDEATFNQMVTQAGKPELVGMFNQRQRLGALYMDDFQKAFETAVGPVADPAALTEGAPTGYKWADPANPAAGVAPLPGYERSSGVTINTGDMGGQGMDWGNPPNDMIWLRDAAGNVITEPDPSGRGVRPVAAPIGGTKAAVDAESAATKRARTSEQSQLKLGTTLESLNLNIKEIEDGGLPVAGAWGDLRRSAPGRIFTGDSAFNFGNRTNQITDSAALAEVQNMRDNSPTGGAVGSLTDDERRAIGNAVTALNSSTGSDEYLRAAKAFRTLALDLAYGQGNWDLQADGQVKLKPGASSAPDIPPGAVDLLRQNDTPDYRRSFDEIFGPGAAASVLGGN